MKHRNPHLYAAILTLFYALLVFVAHVPTFFPPHDALDGILVIVFTLPWSVAMVFVVDAIDPTLQDNTTLATCGLLVCAMVNAVIIYLATNRIVRLANRKDIGPKETN